MPGTLVQVRSGWDSWRTALVAAADLEQAHWHRPPQSPSPLLHAYVSCDKLAAGSLSHVCDAATAPHRLLVCVLKRSVDASTYAEVAGRVGAAESVAPETAMIALERRAGVRGRGLRVQLVVGAALGTMAVWWVRRRHRDRRRRAA